METRPEVPRLYHRARRAGIGGVGQHSSGQGRKPLFYNGRVEQAFWPASYFSTISGKKACAGRRGHAAPGESIDLRLYFAYRRRSGDPANIYFGDYVDEAGSVAAAGAGFGAAAATAGGGAGLPGDAAVSRDSMILLRGA